MVVMRKNNGLLISLKSETSLSESFVIVVTLVVVVVVVWKIMGKS